MYTNAIYIIDLVAIFTPDVEPMYYCSLPKCIIIQNIFWDHLAAKLIQ